MKALDQLRRFFSAGSRPYCSAIVALVLFIGLHLLTGWDWLKYGAAIWGGILLALLPDKPYWRNAVAVAAVAVTVLIQALDDRDQDAQMEGLHRALVDRRANDFTQEAIRQEKEIAARSENFATDPQSTIDSIINADAGFEKNAGRFRLRAMAAEARLALLKPALAELIFAMPAAPRPRAQAYRNLPESRSDPDVRAALPAIQAALNSEAGYLELADYFRRKVKPGYAALLERFNHEHLDPEIGRQELLRIATSFEADLSLFPPGGAYNHLGNMAFGSGMNERAMSWFYRGSTLDPEHPFLYESLAYALWQINGDYRTALKYANLGLRNLERVVAEIAANAPDVERICTELLAKDPTLRPVIEPWRERFREATGGTRTLYLDGPESLTNRFKVDFAYFSAMNRLNEKEARAIATELNEAFPNDPDYQDGRGFVLLLFSRSAAELDQAENLFKKAQDNPQASAVTKKIAAIHFNAVANKRRGLPE